LHGLLAFFTRRFIVHDGGRTWAIAFISKFTKSYATGLATVTGRAYKIIKK